MDKTQTSVGRLFRELEKGGDWERKNKLMVYEGVLLMMVRSFKEGGGVGLEKLT